ncbi:MAG TPA: PhnD/SsuA/transferrin family substrate-binding protein [Polyangia bacterium]|nr:PhnD/SsuA/transferrin family substrate-binding protein [Polyangia bacterium]
MLRFGVSRGHGTPQLVESARRFAELLAGRLGRPARVVMTDDYDHLLQGMVVGGVDLGWLPPLVHARLTPSGAVLAAVSERSGAVTYRSALLTRADAEYLNARALRGVRAAWSDRSSAAGYLFPYLHLVGLGLDAARDFTDETFFGSATAACAAVADGRADVCACFVTEAAAPDGVLDRERALADAARVYPAASWRLRVLDVTDSIPPDGVVIGAHVDGALQARLRDALLELHKREDGAAALAALMQADRLAPVTENVRKTIARLLARVAAR